MNTKQAIIATVGAVLIALACDVPAGSDQGGSAGDNQPKSCALPGAIDQPAALVKVDASQFVYDVYVEIWGVDCKPITLADEGGAEDGQTIPPVHIFVDGHITDEHGNSQFADFLGGAAREKDVNVPYHLRANVSPRSAPHDIVVVADVNRLARDWVREAVDGEGFIHCRILRDSAPIRVPEKSRDKVSHTVALVDGAGQASCHVTVGVG